MIPKQIIPGASNGIASTFSSGKYNDTTYLAYGSSNTVVLLAIGSLQVLQVLGGHQSEVKCVEWSRVGGKIAAGSGNNVVIYAPTSEATQLGEAPKWEAVLTLQHDFEVHAVSWLPSRDFLIVAGSSIQIWEIRKDLVEAHRVHLADLRAFALGQSQSAQTKAAREEYAAQRARAEERRRAKLVRVVWRAQCTAPVAHIACAPDGRFFATAGRFDKVVKVWFARPHRQVPPPPSDAASPNPLPTSPLLNESANTNGKSLVTSGDNDRDVFSDREELSDDEEKEEPLESISFGFIYLPHARSVVSISWRPMKDVPNTKRGWFFQNVLLTQSRDNVVRLWLESLNNRRQQFHMCSVISAGPDSVVSWLSSLSPFECPTIDPFAPVHSEEDDVLDDSQEHVHTSNNCTHNGIARYSKLALSSKLRTAVDWIMGVQRDGTVVIWKLKDVDSHTRQTPALSKWNSMQQVLPLPEVSPNKILAFYDLRGGTVVKDNVRVPIEVSLYVYSVRGAISCWSFSIHGAANQIMNSTLSSRCYGHKGLIRDIAASPSVPLISTVDASKNLILWQSSDTTTVDPPFLLMDVSAMTPVEFLAWSPSGNVCFLSNGEGIFAYEMGLSAADQPSTLPSRLPLAMLEGSAEIGRIVSIGVVADPTAPSSPLARVPSSVPTDSKSQYNVLVVATTAERVMVWRVQLITVHAPSQERPASPSSPQNAKTSPTSSGDSVPVGEQSQQNSPKTDTSMTSTLVTELLVSAPDQKITSASLVTDGYPQRDISARSSPYIPLLLTGGADGTVRLYCLAESEQSPARLRQMTSFKAYESGPVGTIKCAYFGRIATSTPGAAEISIWELESATPMYRLECNLVLTNPNPSGPPPDPHFDWLPLANGKYVIAVGFGKELKIYGPQRPSSLQSFEVEWEVTDTFTSFPQPVCGVAWGKDAGLVVASASVLYLFTKWRDVHTERQSGEHNDESWITTFHRNSEYRSLPLYHPKILLEFLMAGHFERVGYILGKVLHTLNPSGEDSEDEEEELEDEDEEGEDGSPKPKAVPKPKAKVGGEIIIPPIMLDEISGMMKGLASGTTHHEDSSKRKLLDEDGLDELPEAREDDILDGEVKTSGKSAFGAKQAEQLERYLTSVILPGVSGPEQMYLLAIIDTYKQMRETRGALDERGVRFLLAVKIYAFMRRSITGKAAQTTLLQSHDFIWALHSDSQETLLQSCIPADPDWASLKALGVGYWVTNPTTLRQIIEKLAQAAFKARKDPGDCALYYLALKKKGALSVAYKSAKDQKLVEFLANDFTQVRWQTAAAKNAYHLQGKHRFELAAAFFLLAGSLKDAVTVLIQHTHDYQLALVISRLFEGDNGPTYNYVLESLILPAALKSNDYPMASIAKWLLKQYNESLSILQQVAETNASSQAEQQNPSVLNFFKFLSGHTLLRNCPPEVKNQEALLRKAAYSYVQANVDFLALEQLVELKKAHPTIAVDEPDDDEEAGANKDATGKDELKEEEKEKEEPKEEEKEEESSSLGSLGGGYDPFGGYNTSYGGFGGGSGGGGGGGDDWLDELGGGSSSSSATTSSYSFSSGPSFSFGGEEKEEEKKEENKPKEPTKKYLNSTYPAVDNALMFHVVIQVLVEHIERARKLRLWKVEASFMYTNLRTLSLKSGIAVNDIVLELLRYCVARQYIQQAWDLLLEYPDVPSHQLLFFASQYFPPERKHLALLFGAANDIISIANHITSHPLGATQARHISALAVEMYECAESIKEPIPAEETSLIYSAIYLAEFISAWVMEEMPIMENLIKIGNIKGATEAYKAGEKAIEEAEHEELLDDEDDKPQNEPSNSFWLSQLLHLVVLKKFVSNIEEFLSIMQASRAPSSVKLVQHLVRWLRQQQGKLGQIPRSLQKTQTQSHSATTLLQNFADLVRTGRFYSSVAQMWNYISKVEVANDYAASIFVNDEKSHDVLLEYKMTFEPEVVLYKDHDILQSFCINAADNQYVAVATTKGIKEIDLRQVHVGEGGDGTNEEDGEGGAGTGEEYTSSSQLRQSGESILRRSNVTSKSTASLPSFKTKQGILKMAINTLTPSKELDHNIIVQWVESHPHDPYYLSGGIDGSVCLWQFGVPEALAAYRLPPHPWVMRCRFNPSGTKFGACDMAGNLALWKFNAPEDALRPFHSMQAHTKSTLDFTFLNSGSFLATVGISHDSPKRNVCLWDVLQPPHKALVSAFTDHEAGATSVVYSPRHQLLVSGGKKGGIYVFDIRQNKLMESFKAHTHNTKSLSMDLMEQFAVSGASDGNIKVWDLATLNCREVWEDVHKKQTFVRPTGVFKSPVSTYGVMAVGVVGEHIYSCGADKRLIKRKFNYGTM